MVVFTTGRLYNRFRYLRQKSKNSGENNTVATTETQEDQNDEHLMDNLLWLKTVVVSQTNTAEIRKKLDVTRRLRDDMVKKDNVELMQEFPFFFTHPPLVGLINFVIYYLAIRFSMFEHLKSANHHFSSYWINHIRCVYENVVHIICTIPFFVDLRLQMTLF